MVGRFIHIKTFIDPDRQGLHKIFYFVLIDLSSSLFQKCLQEQWKEEITKYFKIQIYGTP